jgi:hypothetical protein
MRNKLFITLLIGLVSTVAFTQQPDMKAIRIADSLTPQEKISRNVILLRSELDSLVKLYTTANQIPVNTREHDPAIVKTDRLYVFGAALLIVLILASMQFSAYRHQRKLGRSMATLHRKMGFDNAKTEKETGTPNKEKQGKQKPNLQVLETRINDLNAELHKLTKENEGLSRVVKEYNGIQHEYDSLMHGMSRAYKIKNYPGYDKGKGETSVIHSVLATENAVAAYAYEKFLKPVLALTDAHKNNPAKISEPDRLKLVELLISLSLLYVEYLYLRINDLAIGGKMVQRIHAFSNGNGLNPSLLKKLNTEHGSRALALRIALDKSGIHNLTYPVFDETDLNNQ